MLITDKFEEVVMVDFRDKLKELATKVGGEYVTAGTGRATTPSEKAMMQAEVMLKKLNAYKNVSDLDYPTSNTYWWSGKATGGRRKVQMYYGGRVVPETCISVDDTLDAVKEVIKGYFEMIKSKSGFDEAFFDAEEKRRSKK